MDGSVLEEKSSFKMLGLSLSSKLEWDFHIVSIVKTALKKTRSLIQFMKFTSSDAVISINLTWKTVVIFRAGGPNCFLDMLGCVCKRYVGLMDFPLLPLLNPWPIVERYPA